MGSMGSREMTVICSLFLVGSCGGASRTIEDLIMGKDSCDLLRPIKLFLTTILNLILRETYCAKVLFFAAHANILSQVLL